MSSNLPLEFLPLEFLHTGTIWVSVFLPVSNTQGCNELWRLCLNNGLPHAGWEPLLVLYWIWRVRKGYSETHPAHKDPQSNKGRALDRRTAEEGRKQDMPQGDCGPPTTPNPWTLCGKRPLSIWSSPHIVFLYICTNQYWRWIKLMKINPKASFSFQTKSSINNRELKDASKSWGLCCTEFNHRLWKQIKKSKPLSRSCSVGPWQM